MEILAVTYSFYFAEPLWLVGSLLLIPIVWLGYRSLNTLSRIRKIIAIVMRCLVVLILIAILARLTRTEKNEQVALIAVMDRSQSIPAKLQDASFAYLSKAIAKKTANDKLAVIDVAEAPSISKLPSGDTEVHKRNTTLNGEQTNLAAGIQMAMAIAPPNTAVRILLMSEGNENAGNLREAARVAATNGIPIDVLGIRYSYKNEVIFRRLAAPTRVRSGQTVSLRFVLDSTVKTSGKLFLSLNGKTIDLDPDSAEVAAKVDLVPGTNVKTVSLPVGTRGIHEFEAEFVPDYPRDDSISQNNRASALTFVSGPGHVLVVDANGAGASALTKILKDSAIDARYCNASEFPNKLTMLMDTDAVILCNLDCGNFSFEQQEMLCRYVKDMGGGLIMTGGPASFGAGGWIGSPIAEILPVDLDPPQKKQLPKGALVLIMHSCEMPEGNLWGERIALAAVQTLSRLDLVGILSYKWQGSGNWVYPLSEVGDKTKVISAIKQMQVGDMPDLGAHLQEAYNKLTACNAAQKHIIIISDGDPQPPTTQLLNQMKAAGITCTGVGVFPHSAADTQSLMRIAQLTGGRFYDVKDPQRLPQIFIKEAQVVRRSLIVEGLFLPQIVYSLSEIIKGLPSALPELDGYVLTGAKGGLNQTIFTSNQGDPIFATCQAGMGRCAAFTSSVDSRWASRWLGWAGNERFWEQTVRWIGKPAESSDCEVMVDVDGRQVNVNVEATDAKGDHIQLAHIDAQVIKPDMSTGMLELNQVGSGQFQGQFAAGVSGNYVLNLRYAKPGEEGKTHLMQTPITVPFAPEFRDLTDNMSLLTEISTMTGGRVLSDDPTKSNLFDHAGLKFPQTQLPMTRPMMLIWLAVFLLDVAVRRVAVDFRAIGRRIVSAVRLKKAEGKEVNALEQLRIKRKKIHEQLSRGSDGTIAAKKYEADVNFKGDIPQTKASVESVKPAEKPTDSGQQSETRKEVAEEQSHIQKLLKAKRRAAERHKDDKMGNGQ